MEQAEALPYIPPLAQIFRFVAGAGLEENPLDDDYWVQTFSNGDSSGIGGGGDFEIED